MELPNEVQTGVHPRNCVEEKRFNATLLKKITFRVNLPSTEGQFPKFGKEKPAQESLSKNRKKPSPVD